MAFEEQENPVNNTLEELSNSDFEIKDGEQDITGWAVLTRSGEEIGQVSDLLFDPQAQKVRYLIVDLQAESDEAQADDSKMILIPIGIAERSDDKETLTVPVDSFAELAGLPAYETGEVKPEDEVQIRSVFGGSEAPYEHPQFYAHEHFNDDKFYNRQSLPDNATIIPADIMDQEGRAQRTAEIMDHLNEHEETVTDESQERENNQPVEETGQNDYQLSRGFIPEPESIEQEEEWQDQEAEGSTTKLMEFFINELKDLYWAEKELTDVLPDMADAATSAELKQAFQLHLTETDTHVNRLEQVFSILGLEPESRKCDAMAGIVDEGDEIISATEDGTAQRDVGLIFAGQKAEHYEIASYGGMVALAKTLGYYDIAELFVLTLDEEKSADAKLTEIAENQANNDANKERSDD